MNKDSFKIKGFSDELLDLPTIKHEEVSDFRERDLASYPKKIQYEVSKRYDYIKWIESHLKGGWTKKNLIPLIKTEPKHISSTRPYWRTVARWWQSFNKSERDILSLIPKHTKKGNCITISSSNKFYEQAVERYLVKERPSIAKVYQYYSDIIRLENETIVGEKIKALSYKGFYKRIKKLPKL